MAIGFGKTWWGEHWLRSLKNVDYDNRLARGASYAKKGNVSVVKIEKNTIHAEVQGSRKSPYRVTIVVPPFFDDQIELLMAKLIRKPALLSKLLNRELDPAILDIAQEAGLKVFPRQWTDFKMICTCPDWAVPCKHLAAVIYMVSREIDNNPFLVFEMHNVDLIQELSKRGIQIAGQKKREIPLLCSFRVPKRKDKTAYDDEKAYARVDFSKLNNLADALVMLLPDAPPFYPLGNFRDKYRKRYMRMAQDAKRLLTRRLDFDAIFPPKDACCALSHHSTILLIANNNNGARLQIGEVQTNDFGSLVAALWKLNADHLPDYQPTVAAAHKLLIASLHLISNGNVVPQIVELDNKQFAIRWLPALIDEQVRLLVNKLDDIPDLLCTTKVTSKDRRTVGIDHQATEALSLFITAIVQALPRPMTQDLFEDFFFACKPYAFDGVGEAALSGGVKVWLDRYFLASGAYKPLITVREVYGEAFEIDVCIEGGEQADALPVPLREVLDSDRFDDSRYKILQSISLLSPFIKGLDAHIDGGAEQPIRLCLREFTPFLIDLLPAIRLLGVRVVLPKSLQALMCPKASFALRTKTDGASFIRLEDVLAFDWRVALGSSLLSPEEFEQLLDGASGLFRFKGQYFYASEAEVNKLHKALSGGGKSPTSFQLLQAALSEEYQGAAVSLSDEVRSLIAELTSVEEIPLPQDLNAQLRPYQQRGYSWMYRNSRIGFGSIIADDMGLGKTLQVIAILLKYKEEGLINHKQKALVVVLTGLLINWQMEIAKFAPSLSVGVYHGSSRSLKTIDADIVLTTYGMIRSDVEAFRQANWQALVIDEAQQIKNESTGQAKAVKSIRAHVRIAMSGTPVENRLSEFWSIMDYANKGYLGSAKAFKDDFGTPIQVFNDEDAVSLFRKITSPFMMRRMKSDKTIINDLPDKIEQNQYALLTKEQAALYEQTMQSAMSTIEGLDSGDTSLFERQGLVLQMILALKQICNHPTNFLKNGHYDPALSGKVNLLLELLDSMLSAGEKVLIFTQFREMGDLLVRFIGEHFGESPMFYHGGCSIEQRQEMVDRFQHNRADKVFILSLKAAGTGLNLTAASHVVHFDLWWNPAVENQATDRAYRIGQSKNVMVHRLITKNTFEEKIDGMIQRKKDLAEMTVATGEKWLGHLSNKELREIFVQH